MSTPHQVSDSPQLGTDPAEQIAFFRRALRARLRTANAEDIEDLASECWIELHRARRQSEPDNLAAFMNTIAARRAIDRLRAPAGKFGATESPPDDSLLLAASESSLREEIDRVRFIVLGFFRERGSVHCERYALAWFSDLSWKPIADSEGVSYTTVTKRWERCKKELRAEEESSPGFLSRFLEFMP